MAEEETRDNERALVVLRHGETFIKGGNRRFFEKVLRDNVRRALAPLGEVELARGQGRFFVHCPRRQLERALVALEQVFGLSSLSPAQPVPREIEAIAAAAVRAGRAEVARRPAASFRVTTQRADKSFTLTSLEINRQVGAEVARALQLPVDLHRPQLVVGVEIGSEHSFVYARRIPGAGGLPVACSGEVLLLLSGGIDSPVAGHLAQKRGCRLHALYFHSPPHTSEHARDKVVQLGQRLAARQGGLSLHVVRFTAIQERVRDRAPAELAVVLYRRAMVRIASRLASRQRCLALVTGENLGQVASQTLENMACIERAAELPVLRPLIGFDKQEIIALARRIETYETSILPHEDCCSLFVPRHPATRAHAAQATAAEEGLELEPLLARAVEEVETERLEPW